MNMTNDHLSIFNEFNFDIQPIGLRFSLTKPDDIERLDKKLAYCEMFKEAQNATKPFYTDFENHICGGGPGSLGQGGVRPEITSAIHAGMLGPKLKIFKDNIANRRTLLSYPKLEKDTVKYVLFSPMNSLSFVPEILLITAKPRQAEIIMRASSYINGAVWETKNTSIVDCAWLTIYPYLTGRINYTVTGFSFGMIARELWPEGLILLSIPRDRLLDITTNLQDMEWELPNYQVGREKHDALEEILFNELIAEISSLNQDENISEG